MPKAKGAKHSAKSGSGGKRKLNVKKLVIAAAVVIAAVYFVYFVIWQQVTISSKNKEISELEQRVGEATEESERLKQEIENLNDPEYIERVARDELGLVRPNERVFVDSNKSEDNSDR